MLQRLILFRSLAQTNQNFLLPRCKHASLKIKEFTLLSEDKHKEGQLGGGDVEDVRPRFESKETFL